jgi:hypothetical protein
VPDLGPREDAGGQLEASAACASAPVGPRKEAIWSRVALEAPAARRESMAWKESGEKARFLPLPRLSRRRTERAAWSLAASAWFAIDWDLTYSARQEIAAVWVRFRRLECCSTIE